MDRIVAGIDLSRKHFDVACLDPNGEVLLGHQRFHNSPSGAQQLCQALDGLIDEHGYHGAKIAAESTGLLWLHLMQALREHDADYELYLLNPRDVRQFGKAMAQQDKTDRKDAYLIAERLRFRPPRHPLTIDVRYLPLQRLTRYRYALVNQLVREKTRLMETVYLRASAYLTVRPFSDVFGVTSRQVLGGEHTLDELAELPLDHLVEWLQAQGSNRFPKPKRNAAKLKQVVDESYPLPDELGNAADTVLEIGLSHLRALEARIAELDERIAAQAAKLPGYHTLLTIPGIGPVYAAGLVAEIGNVERFRRGTKLDRNARPRTKSRRDAEASLAKLAGLFWPRNESGDFQGQDRPLSKRGNVYLRYYLIQAANNVRRHAPKYETFYKRKYRQAVRHHHRRALVLTARKLVRLLFAMLEDGRPYQQPAEVPAM